MNNEARNLRLSILLFFQPRASARQSGPHTRIGYTQLDTRVRICTLHILARSRSHACVCVCACMCANAFVWVARTFRKQSSCWRERASPLSARRRDRCIDTGNGAIHDEKKAEKLAAGYECVGVSTRSCVRVRHDGETCVPTSDAHAL